MQQPASSSERAGAQRVRLFRSAAGRGFSAIEVVVWVAVFVVTMIAIAASVIFFYRSNKAAINQANAVAGAQNGIDTMMTTIREASYSSSGAYPVISLTPNDLRFYAAVPGQTSAEEVHFYLATTSGGAATLYEGTIIPTGDPASYSGAESTSTLTGYVQNLAKGQSLFTFYDGSGNQITDYAQIQNLRFVTANLSLNVDPTRPQPVVLRSSATMRVLVGQ